MYYPKESQFTGHASKRVYEEVYTNEDMTNDSAYIWGDQIHVKMNI